MRAVCCDSRNPLGMTRMAPVRSQALGVGLSSDITMKTGLDEAPNKDLGTCSLPELAIPIDLLESAA